MNRITIRSILMVWTLPLLLGLPACEKEVEEGTVKMSRGDLRDAKAAVEELRDLTESEIGAYKRAIKERLEIFDQKLEELEQKVGKPAVAELRKMSGRVHQKLEEAKDATGEAWDQARRDIEAAIDELVAAYERTEARCG